jgi:hypothetical protein
MLGLLLALLALLRAATRDRGDLVAENALLRQQLAVLTRPSQKRPRLRTRDKLFWVLVRAIRRDWCRHLLLVRPENVVAWRRNGRRLVWGGRSRGRPGRPRLAVETRALIARMARENPAWGAERIRGELLKLGIVVSKRSVQRYRRRGPARPPSQTWRTFVANHLGQLRAGDVSSAADVPPFVGAAVLGPWAGCSPASAPDGSLGRSPPAPVTCRDAPGTAAALADPGDCDASARDPREKVRRLSDRRRLAASAPRAHLVRRVRHSRAPPRQAPAPGHRSAARGTTGPIRVRTVAAGMPHRHEQAA